MSFDWKSAVRSVAPILGTALGGPIGGAATKMISNALLGKEDGSEDEISMAMQTASPETLVALKEADNNFKVKMKELGIKEKDLVFGDKRSAREMNARTKARTPSILAYILTVMVGCMVYGLMKWTLPEGNVNVINIVFGSVMTVWIGAMQFFHGATIKDDDR